MPGEGSAGQETKDCGQDVDDQEDHVGPLQAHVRRPGHFLHPPDWWSLLLVLILKISNKNYTAAQAGKLPVVMKL